MRNIQQCVAPHLGSQELVAGLAHTLAAAARVRHLRVIAGRVWLTRTRAGTAASADEWLDTGALVALNEGETAVIEAWPSARIEVLEDRPLQSKQSWFGTRFARMAARMAARIAAPRHGGHALGA